jgi:long-chain acyl-CoA synthetase
LFPKRDFLNCRENGVWRAYSTEEIHQRVYSLAQGLLNAGISSHSGSVESRDKIAIISSGRPEWIIVDLAVQLTGAILVPLYINTNTKELEHILKEADIKYIFAGDEQLCSTLVSLQDNVPSLEKVISLSYSSICSNWEEWLIPVNETEKAYIDSITETVDENDVVTIIYTSGTTGNPKGVMLTHKNIISNIRATEDILKKIPVKNRQSLSFLPLNHVFEKMVMYVYLFNGFSIYFAESLDTIGRDMRETKPEVFTAVPRLLEKVYEKIISEGDKLTGLKRKIFTWAVNLADDYGVAHKRKLYNLQLYLADRLVFQKWRKAIGGRIKAVIVGSSACPQKLQRIFTAANIVIMEGYGLTETSPVISVNHYDAAMRKLGTVGPLLTGVTVNIGHDGEILCKGPNLSPGYYKNEELTKEVFKNGWFHTGDIGIVDNAGFLRITGRKKEIFKTSGGKYVAPVYIENKIRENFFIAQIMVIGEGRKFVSALIVPDFNRLQQWCKEQNLNLTNHQSVSNDKVIDYFESIIKEYNKEFNHVEQIKKIMLLPREWTVEAGEVTPTGKLKRNVINEKYNNDIESLYSGFL